MTISKMSVGNKIVLSVTALVVTFLAIFILVPIASNAFITNEEDNSSTNTSYSVECANAPQVPTFNPFPTTYSGAGCSDYPLVDGRIVNGGMFSKDSTDWANGVTAKAGDEILVRVYIHNGADPSIKLNQALNNPKTAKNVRAQIFTSSNTGTNQTIKVSAVGDNLETITSTFNIRIGENDKLMAVEGSGQIQNKSLNILSSGFTVSTGSSEVALGDMKACFEYLRWITFKVKVVSNTPVSTPTPTPTSTSTSTPTPSATKTPKATTTPLASLTAPSCLIDKNVSGRLVFDLNPKGNEWISSDNVTYPNNLWQTPVGANIPAGTYKVTLHGWDDHTSHGGQNQPNEVFNVRFRAPGVTTSQIAQSPNSIDIPENSNNSSLVVVGTVTLSESAGNIYAHHGKAGDTSSPNSLTAICVGLDPVYTPTPKIPTPSVNAFCDSNTPKATISWNQAGKGANGYFIDIDNDNNWTNGYYNKFVSSGSTSTTSPDGFTWFTGGGFSMTSNSTYYTRIFYVETGEHSPVKSFTTSNCNTNTNTTIGLSKTVRNITQNSSEVENASANPGDTIEFIIRVSNTGNYTATNVKVSDSLPSNLTYQTGTTTVDGSGYADGITSGGINLGSLNTNQTKTIRFRVQVAGSGNFGNGTTTLTNTATATSDNSPSKNDTAVVSVYKSTTSPLTCSPSGQTIQTNQNITFTANGGNGNYSWYASNGNTTNGSGSTFTTRYSSNGTMYVNLTSDNQTVSCVVFVQPQNSSTSMTIDKVVRNITDGNTSEFNSISARPGDTVEFIIRVYNNGHTALNNVRVSDSLPGGMTYNSGSTTLDGNYISDGIVSSGINIGTLNVNQSKTIRFRAQIKETAYFSTTSTTLTNYGYTSADNFGTINDTAFVSVNKIITDNNPVGYLTIKKFGKDVTKGESADKTSVATAPTDTLEFVLVVKNTGSTNLNNVIVRDALPSGMTYINKTTSVNNNIVADGIVSGGINIGTLTPNQEVRIRFNVTVNSTANFSLGTTYLTNYGFVKADNAGEVNASLPISVIRGSVLGTVSKTPTGANTMAITLALAMIATSMYATYTKTNIFKKRDAKSIAKQHRKDSDRFNFAR